MVRRVGTLRGGRQVGRSFVVRSMGGVGDVEFGIDLANFSLK
jgi:hypothetical protein